MSLSNKIKVLFEDDSLIVINKPTGVVVNISETSPEDTVQNYLASKLGLKVTDESEFMQRTGLVHRIDKDTSGLVLAAKNERIFKQLKKQFKDRKVDKVYLAVVLDHLIDPLINISAPIKRDPKNRLRMAIVSDGRKALTKIELIKNFKVGDLEVAMLRIMPKTGRTHQIRVHLAAINHPVVSDHIYMTRKQLSVSQKKFERLMLHAWKLSVYHPKLKKELNFDAPIPEEFDKMYSKYA